MALINCLWSGRRDSNPHGRSARQHLKLARLSIPPRPDVIRYGYGRAPWLRTEARVHSFYRLDFSVAMYDVNTLDGSVTYEPLSHINRCLFFGLKSEQTQIYISVWTPVRVELFRSML